MKKLCIRIVALLMLATLMVGCFAGCTPEEETEVKINLPEPGVPVTLDVMVYRHPEGQSDGEELWYFNYLEHWLAEEYDLDVSLNVVNSDASQVSLQLSGNNLPDLVFGIGLAANDAVKFGSEEEMILDWTPYLNETYMPNLTAHLKADPGIKTASTLPDGKIYGLPYIKPRMAYSGIIGQSERFFLRQSWLDEIGMKNPTTYDELLAVLRAMKAKHPDRYTVVTSEGFLEKYVWTCLGFYGTEPAKYGTKFMIDKDGKLVLPCYDPQYKEFIKFMNTLVSEGILAKDYASAANAQAVAYSQNGGAGGYCWWTLDSMASEKDLGLDWVSVNPVPMGDVKSVDEIHVSALSTYDVNKAWASADTEYPALVALIMDFMYSDEGAFLYRYGVPEGQDPLNMIDGYKYDAKGNITTKLVENKTYNNMTNYGRDILYPADNVGVRPAVVTTGSGKMKEYTDSVTGEKYTALDTMYLDPATNVGSYYLTVIEHWTKHMTTIRLPAVYMNGDDVFDNTQYSTAIADYVTAESMNFIKGTRPCTDAEFEKFFAELKQLGVEDYIALNQSALEGWMNTTFGK